MGTIEKGVKCKTCSMDYIKCKGHFGHVALALPVVNSICLKKLKRIVKHICKKCKRIVITKQHLSIKKVVSSFHCSAPQTSDDMFDVDNKEDLEEVSKTLTNMCQDNIDVLNIKGSQLKSCMMHYFPIIPTCVRTFLTNKGESFDDDLICQLSEMKKFLSLGMKPNAKDIQRLTFHINTYYDNRKKKSGHSASGHAYEEIRDILKRKGGHIRKDLCEKGVNQGTRTVVTPL